VPPINIDDIDTSILKELSEDARAPLSIISKKVNLSIPAVSERIKKLEKNGYIDKYTIILEPKKFNKNLTCYCFLTLKYDEKVAVQDFSRLVRSEPDILECHTITGDYEFLLKIVTDGTDNLEKLLSKIRKEAHVLTSSTSIILSTLKSQPSYMP